MKLKKLRTAKKMSRYELARRAKISRVYVTKLESGGSDPTVGMLQRLATALGEPVTEVLEMNKDWTLDVSGLADTRVGNFICQLTGDAREEAIQLLLDLQGRAWRYAGGQLPGPLHKVFDLKPIKGVPGLFEKRGRTMRIYVKYGSDAKLTIIHGGPKATQAADIARLKKGLRGPSRGRRRAG